MTQHDQLIGAARIDQGIARPLDACDETMACLRAAGRRGAAPALTGEALARYWPVVAVTRVEQRIAMLRELLEDIAAGLTTVRACVPVALGDPEFHLAREATLAYLGGWPASVDRRAQVVDEIVDWIVRGLALDRAAIFCALLERADAGCLERLARLRTRLDARETAAVLAAFRGRAIDREVTTFLEEWRSLSSAEASVSA